MTGWTPRSARSTVASATSSSNASWVTMKCLWPSSAGASACRASVHVRSKRVPSESFASASWDSKSTPLEPLPDNNKACGLRPQAFYFCASATSNELEGDFAAEHREVDVPEERRELHVELWRHEHAEVVREAIADGRAD